MKLQRVKIYLIIQLIVTHYKYKLPHVGRRSLCYQVTLATFSLCLLFLGGLWKLDRSTLKSSPEWPTISNWKHGKSRWIIYSLKIKEQTKLNITKAWVKIKQLAVRFLSMVKLFLCEMDKSIAGQGYMSLGRNYWKLHCTCIRYVCTNSVNIHS